MLLYPFQGIIWDGGFPSAEFRLRFVDEHGQPVAGVRLEVFTQAGGPSPHYPINEFRPGQLVASDADGRMTIHHVGQMEFGGREYSNLVGMKFGETHSPDYDCVFSLEGREVHRVGYRKFYPWREGMPTVERDWSFETWSAEQWDAYDFDLNHDGTFDREERVARTYVIWNFELGKSARKRFDIVEKTIAISRPR